jgi:nucleoside-diphosphate-sugar epimerase
VSGASAPEGPAADPPRDDLCLITGASGFIGGRLAERMARDGYAVRCLARASSDTSALARLRVPIVLGDLTDASSLARAADGCSHVVHCGALVSDWATKNEIKKINVGGTRLLLDASADAGVRRFVHLSTTDVYGYPGGHAIDESYEATRFRNWYAQTKLEAEAEVRRAERERALEVVILRPATVYGPGSAEVVGEIARAIRSRNMLLIGRGRAVAGLCYVNNLIDAALIALRSDAAAGQAFNLSDGLDVTWRQFADDLAAGLASPPVRWSMPYPLALAIGFSLEHGYRLARSATGLTAPALLSRQAVHVLGTAQDFSNRKAREKLRWEPRVGYRDGLDATLAWLKTEYLEPA